MTAPLEPDGPTGPTGAEGVGLETLTSVMSDWSRRVFVYYRSLGAGGRV